jgi:hypothetical protein
MNVELSKSFNKSAWLTGDRDGDTYVINSDFEGHRRAYAAAYSADRRLLRIQRDSMHRAHIRCLALSRKESTKLSIGIIVPAHGFVDRPIVGWEAERLVPGEDDG